MMLRHLRAVVWLRWRLMANALHGGKRRDRFEQISRAIALMVPIIIAGLSIGTVLAVGVIGYLGGRAAATALVDPRVVVLVLRGVLIAMLGLVIVFSITSPTQSALARYSRLLLLPISRKVLHVVEVLANLADPWLVFVGIAMVAFAAGIVAGGRPGAALATLLVTVAIMGLLAALASFISFVVGTLLRSRRRGEMLTLVFVLAVSVVGLLPAFLTRDLQSGSRAERRAARAERRFSPEQLEASLPVWMRALPTEIAGRTVLAGLEGRGASVAGGLALLALQGGALFVASSRMHARMIRSLESDQGRRRASSRPFAPVSLPLVSPAASAIGWAQLRTALRSVRGRIAILLPGPMIALLSLLVRGERDNEVLAIAAEQGHFIAGAGMIFSMYAILPFTMNCFGVDRAGLTLQFLAPVRDRDIAWGKTMGGLLIFAVAATLSVGGAAAVNPTGSPYSWLAVLLGGAATYLLMSPIAIWMSALFPVAADLSKTGSGGNPHPLPMLLGTVLVLIFAAPAALVIAASQFWFHRPVLAPLLLVWWLALAAVIAVVGVRAAARAIDARRENLVLVAKNS
jgi:hypothetical protein